MVIQLPAIVVALVRVISVIAAILGMVQFVLLVAQIPAPLLGIIVEQPQFVALVLTAATVLLLKFVA